MIRPVVICGGGGTRLWPLSTPQTPKQFLAITGDKTMLDETLGRVDDRTLFAEPRAIGSLRHKSLLERSLRPEQIVMEPMGRNSAPAIAIAALMAEPDEIVLILPADHHIGDVPAFHEAIKQAIEPAQDDQIVTFGIKPDFPATGYGYIEAGETDGFNLNVSEVLKFVEKPDEDTAKGYLESGRHYWNAGIFQFKASAMIAALSAYAPDILNSVKTALSSDGTLDRAAFAECRSESIDYAVMEAANNIRVVPVSMAWSDVGDYRAVHGLRAKAQSDDRVLSGPAAAPKSERILIHSTGPQVAVHGIDDIAVIATPNAVLVSGLDAAAGIKSAVSQVQDHALNGLSEAQRSRLGAYLWNDVLPVWANLAIDQKTGGAIESLNLDGRAEPDKTRRGRVAPRQLFSFARAKALGWNPNGRADEVIDACVTYLNGAARSDRGGWAHKIAADGTLELSSRDFYDHAFVALAGAELAGLGDARGEALSQEAFQLIDTLFLDPEHKGWQDCETPSAGKSANPHMHLLEASLRHYDVTADQKSLNRINEIMTLFERSMFDPQSDAVLEDFGADWSRLDTSAIEPGHCYEWAFLLSEVQRLTGRDSVSWLRRLTRFADRSGVTNSLVVDRIDMPNPTYRLWPQLERLRLNLTLGTNAQLVRDIADDIWTHYLSRGPEHGWVDQLDHNLTPISQTVPASMIYHFMSNLAPFVEPPK